jgi:hypothetical protein
MNNSPHPPNCAEAIEKHVISEILRRLKYSLISVIALFVFIGIANVYKIPIYIFWFIFLVLFVNACRWIWKFTKIECPNCGEPFPISGFGIPKKCNYCHAKFK